MTLQQPSPWLCSLILLCWGPQPQFTYQSSTSQNEFCVFMFIFMHLCVCGCTWVFIHMEMRTKVVTPQVSPIFFFFWDNISRWPEIYHIGQGSWPVSIQGSICLCLFVSQMATMSLAFHSGPCEASLLVTEPSPQPLKLPFRTHWTLSAAAHVSPLMFLFRQHLEGKDLKGSCYSAISILLY